MTTLRRSMYDPPFRFLNFSCIIVTALLQISLAINHRFLEIIAA